MTNSGENTLRLQENEILLILAEKTRLGEVLESLGVGRIEKKESGEPALPGSPYFISFSHKDDMAVAAISDSAVGVDIENVTVPRNIQRLSRLFHESEVPESLYDFYRLWTSKEAIGKQSGTGITFDVLKQKSTDVRHLDHGDYIICVAGKGEITMKVY